MHANAHGQLNRLTTNHAAPLHTRDGLTTAASTSTCGSSRCVPRRPAVFGTDRRENASHSPVAATTQVCRREWERDDDFRPASRPASQHSTTTQLAALLARPKHPLVVGGDEPFTFLYDYGTQSRLELRVVSAKLAGAVPPASHDPRSPFWPCKIILTRTKPHAAGSCSNPI